MKGFFDGIDPDMEFAAQIDGCSRWGAFFAEGIAPRFFFGWREAKPSLRVPGNRAVCRGRVVSVHGSLTRSPETLARESR